MRTKTQHLDNWAILSLWRDPGVRQRWIACVLLSWMGCWGVLLSAAHAAVPTGTILGTVSDSSGAVIPAAAVTVTHESTGASRSMSTDSSGNFTFPLLSVGNYTLKVEKEGFQTFKQKEILLQVDKNLTIAVTLQLGEITQEVTVEGATAGVDLVKATISEVVDQRRIVDLPLNGRDPLQLQSLMPGVVLDNNNVSHGQGQHQGLVVNGNRPASNYYLMDGVDAIDGYLAVAPAFPAPDALQEFSVQTSVFSAEYGRNAGALVNAVVRAGSNEFHGTLFEFFRNTKLNANDFFANRAGRSKPAFNLNQYGGTFGGPIRKDKTFFFGYYQGTNRRKNNVLTVPNVLTARQRPDLNPSSVADFSEVCPGASCPRDPRTGQFFPNFIIPRDRVDPVAVKFVSRVMPLPNSGLSYVFNGPSAATNDKLDETQFIGRIDHTFSNADKFFGRYFYNYDEAGGLTNNIPDVNFIKKFRNQNLGLNWTHTFSPVMLNTATFGFNRLWHLRGPDIDIGWSDFGGPCSAWGCGQRPPFNRQYVITIAGSLATGSNMGTFGQPRTTFQASDVLSWVKGKHTLKLGVDYRRESVNRFEDFLSEPTISFTNQFTGNGLSDFLLGLPATFRQDNLVESQLRHTSPNLFVSDNIKLQPNLTVDLGLRWEPYLPPVDNLNNQLCLDPTFTKRSKFYPTAPPGILFPGPPLGTSFGEGDAECPRQLFPNRWANFAPRFGVAWDPFSKGKTSIRAGYGVFWEQIRLIGYNRFSTAQPFALSRNITSPGNPSNNFAPSLSGDLIYTNSGQINPFPFITPRTPEQRANYYPAYKGRWVGPALESFFNPDWNQAYVQGFNLSIQQELWQNYAFTVAYVGNKATHLWTARELNPAIPLPLSVMSAAQQRANTDERRRFSSIRCLNQADQSIPCYGPLGLQDNPLWSNFHSLQISMNRKFSGGLTFLGSYVWSKYIDILSLGTEGNSGPRNPFNLIADKGLSDNDIAHRFVASYIWEVPKIRSLTGVSNVLVNGWQFNGITTIQSGSPFTVLSGRDASLTSIGKDTADYVPGQIPQLDSGRPNGQLVDQYFNTAAFQSAADGTFGTTGRNTLRGPGIINFDFAVFKDFQVSERWGKIQFRNEYFNVFNNVNLLNPQNSLAAGSAFGRIVATRDPRFVQFALKWIF
jgi:Carboxypeptidase regulatory-like domain/TonB-dependent Receptor Plug Domain